MRHQPTSGLVTTQDYFQSKIIIATAIIFLIASGVRLLHWQDRHLDSGQESLTHRYLQQAQQTLDGEGVLFPRDFNNPVNVQLLVHPPGYSIFVATVFRLFGNSNNTLIVVQILADSAAAVMVALIAAELFPFAVATIAGLLVAFSPHLARYSLFLLPESLSALPILIAMYFLIVSLKRPRLATIIATGFFIGLSCWLRANALLLSVFVALAVMFLFERGKRLRYSLTLIAATLITISPITIRNAVVFHHFIPLSIGEGITLIEGIGVYDEQNRFGMPRTDFEAKLKDVEWHNRPDYLDGRWKPDGIERDRYRFRRGLEVIRSNPLWFAGVMIRRAAFMLRYNSSVSEGWPWDTARVPIVATEPSFGHQLEIPPETEPVWTSNVQKIIAGAERLSPDAETQLPKDGQMLEVIGDASEFGDQFAFGPIEVQKNTDYILRLKARLVQGRIAAKVTSLDRRISLSSEPIVEPENKKPKAKHREDDDVDDSNNDNPSELNDDPERSLPILEMPFATGNRTQLLLVISNNGASSTRSTVQIGAPELYAVGPTPLLWSRSIRPAVRGIQRNLYTTSRMLPLWLLGIVLLALGRRKIELALLLIVPLYYLSVQSVFHTEYRYILAIHYFLFIIAAVSLYLGARLIGRGAHQAFTASRRIGWAKRTGEQA